MTFYMSSKRSLLFQVGDAEGVGINKLRRKGFGIELRQKLAPEFWMRTSLYLGVRVSV